MRFGPHFQFDDRRVVSTRVPGTITMPASQARLLPVVDPERHLVDAYSEILETSDIRCLLSLLKAGKLEVLKDRDTRRVTITSSDEKVTNFLNSVFGVTKKDT